MKTSLRYREVIPDARRVLFDSGLQDRYERGQVTSPSYASIVRENFDLDEEKLPTEDLLIAISDMFTPIDSMVEVVETALKRTGRIGVHSNKCHAHWLWVRRQQWPVSQIDYDVKILSCEVMSMKPDAEIYEAAEKAAHVRPDRILFLDDKPENVAMARKRGWKAEQCLGGDQAKAVVERFLIN